MAGAQPSDVRQMAFSHSRHLPGFMAEAGLSFGFTAYGTGRVFLVGLDEAQRLSLLQRSFTRAMGLYADEQRIWLADLFQLWRFDALLPEGAASLDGIRYDRLYAPRASHVTGDIDIHDIGLDDRDRPIFVSALYSCLATTSDDASFAEVWRPPFVSRLAAEDRCHLNGLAMRAGRPAYVTACARTDAVSGWRDHRHSGGVVLSVPAGEVVCEGLSMPHSPRIRATPKGEELWVLNSGTGYLGQVVNGAFEPRAFCPGFLRGLALFGDHALVTTSLPRGGDFRGLPIEAELARRNAAPTCSILVIDLRSGDVAHWLRFDTHLEELYDVAVIPGARRPGHVGLRGEAVRRLVTAAPNP